MGVLSKHLSNGRGSVGSGVDQFGSAELPGGHRMLVDGGWDAVWTVSETDSKEHPLKQLTVNEDRLDYYDPRGAEIIARQQLDAVYHRNGVAYAMTRCCLVEKESIKGERTGALVIEGQMVSIDTLWDLELAEFIYGRYA